MHVSIAILNTAFQYCIVVEYTHSALCSNHPFCTQYCCGRSVLTLSSGWQQNYLLGDEIEILTAVELFIIQQRYH